MKKRKIKDFIALYALEGEEKLALIQTGTSAGKTFLDTFWTANTYALAMADIQTQTAFKTFWDKRLALYSIDIFADRHTHNIADLYDGVIEIIPIPTVEEFNVHV